MLIVLRYMRRGFYYQKLTVFQVVGEVGVEHNDLNRGKLGVVLDFRVNWISESNWLTISELFLKLSWLYRKLGWRSEMPLHITRLGSQHRCSRSFWLLFTSSLLLMSWSNWTSSPMRMSLITYVIEQHLHWNGGQPDPSQLTRKSLCNLKLSSSWTFLDNSNMQCSENFSYSF